MNPIIFLQLSIIQIFKQQCSAYKLKILGNQMTDYGKFTCNESLNWYNICYITFLF